MAIDHNVSRSDRPSFSLDDLYCQEEEEKWGDLEEDCSDEFCNVSKSHVSEQDLFWEDEELLSLFSKEEETHLISSEIEKDPFLSAARGEGVGWILKVNASFGFSTLTLVLAVNYLDRFLSSLHFQKEKPWMIHLASVTCLSLAAKMEEIQVPLLLDLQVAESKYVFEAKTIQKMELLILSTLKWRMNPVTPLSFLDHIIRRLGLKSHLHWKFLTQCETLLLSVMPDARIVRYMPSMLASAIMLHSINKVDPCNAIDYQNQLLGVLKTTMKKVKDCYELISELSNSSSNKRKYEDDRGIPCSPSGVTDAIFSSESSNDSWVTADSPVLSLPLKKRSKIQEQRMRLSSLSSSSSSRVFVEIIGSPR